MIQRIFDCFREALKWNEVHQSYTGKGILCYREDSYKSIFNKNLESIYKPHKNLTEEKLMEI